jgi:hypothetical protein
MYECTALHPGPPERDVEEWPLLDLSDATVVRFRRDQPSELVDLFEVVACSEETVRVVGRLEKVPKGWAKCGKLYFSPEGPAKGGMADGA